MAKKRSKDQLTKGELTSWLPVVAFLETLPRALDAQLKHDADINHFEYTVLGTLGTAVNGSMPMAELADAAFGSISRLSHAVTRLEARGWLERSDGSGRSRSVTLTKLGWEALHRSTPAHADEVRRLFLDAMTPAEFEQLAALACKALLVAAPERAASLDQIIARLQA